MGDFISPSLLLLNAWVTWFGSLRTTSGGGEIKAVSTSGISKLQQISRGDINTPWIKASTWGLSFCIRQELDELVQKQWKIKLSVKVAFFCIYNFSLPWQLIYVIRWELGYQSVLLLMSFQNFLSADMDERGRNVLIFLSWLLQTSCNSSDSIDFLSWIINWQQVIC